MLRSNLLAVAYRVVHIRFVFNAPTEDDTVVILRRLFCRRKE